MIFCFRCILRSVYQQFHCYLMYVSKDCGLWEPFHQKLLLRENVL